ASTAGPRACGQAEPSCASRPLSCSTPLWAPRPARWRWPPCAACNACCDDSGVACELQSAIRMSHVGPDDRLDRRVASQLLDVLIRAGLVGVLAVLCYVVFAPFLTL